MEIVSFSSGLGNADPLQAWLPTITKSVVTRVAHFTQAIAFDFSLLLAAIAAGSRRRAERPVFFFPLPQKFLRIPRGKDFRQELPNGIVDRFLPGIIRRKIDVKFDPQGEFPLTLKAI